MRVFLAASAVCLTSLLLNGCGAWPGASSIVVPVTEVACGGGVNANHLCVGSYRLSSDMEFTLYPAQHTGTLRIIRNDGLWLATLIELSKCVVADKENWVCTDGIAGQGVWTEYEMRHGYYTRQVLSAYDVQSGTISPPVARNLHGWFSNDYELRFLKLECEVGLESYPSFFTNPSTPNP